MNRNWQKMCLMEFQRVLQNKNKLRDFKPGRIYIAENLTKKRNERYKHKIWKGKAREMREKGNIVRIGYNNKTAVNYIEWRCSNMERRIIEPMTQKNQKT